MARNGSDGSVTGDDPGTPATGSGLPAQGPGSVAGLGRRLLALVVDWLTCLLIATGFALDRVWAGRRSCCVVEQTLLVGLLGYSMGHRLLGLRWPAWTARRRAGARPRPGGAAGLAIPPLVMDRDGRGLHDLAAGTVVVRR